MKTKLFFAYGVLFLSLSIIASANPAEKKTKNGKILNMEIVSEGTVNLYKVDVEVLKATIPEDPMESYTETETTYYIGYANDESVKKITLTNYKKLLTSHMTGNSEVSTKIGRKGYKFVNVEGIFMAYNSN
jgi:D-tyrosyl-tRNA(Tyr) deacylase